MSKTLPLLLVALFGAACRDDPSVAARRDGSRICDGRPLHLEVGESAVPAQDGQIRCTVAAIQGAEYVFAWLDTRALTGARIGIEPMFEPYPIGITIAPEQLSLREALAAEGAPRSALAADAATRQAFPDHGASPADAAPRPITPLLVDDVVLEARPRHRRTPWTLGEEFVLEDDLTGLPRQARIVRDYGGHTVVARWTDESENDEARFLSQLDTAFALLETQLAPLWRATFVDAPLTSSQAGQYLILLQREELTQARALADISGDTLYPWLQLYPFPVTSALRLALLVGHEMTHHYQMLYMHGTRGSPGVPTVPAASFWGYEGGANLMTYEMLRRITGIPLDANHEWRTPPTSGAVSIFQQRAQPGNGVLTDGFDSAMGFLRDLMLRRMASGETVGDALRAVSRGAIEGWYGFDGVTRRQGLVSRMRTTLGEGWEPEEALLDWALSYAADDVTPNPRYQDRASLRVWDLPSGQLFGWWPDALLSDAAPTFFLFKRFGSPGYARIRGADDGFTVGVEAFAIPIRWRLLRVR